MRELLHRFDTYFTKHIQAWPKQLRHLMKFISMTGFPFVTLGIGIVLVMSGVGYGRSDYILSGVTIFVTVSVSSLLKLWLRRTRPLTYIPKRWFIATASFPSGHSTGAAVAYGTLSLLAIHFVSFPVGVVVAILLGMWVVLIGISRVYLGAHYPSDVIAGWLLGLVGVLVVAAGVF